MFSQNYDKNHGRKKRNKLLGLLSIKIDNIAISQSTR